MKFKESDPLDVLKQEINVILVLFGLVKSTNVEVIQIFNNLFVLVDFFDIILLLIFKVSAFLVFRVESLYGFMRYQVF